MNGSFVGPISLWNHPRRLRQRPAATSWPARTAANGAAVSWASLYHECSQSHEKKGGSRRRPPHWRTVRRSLMIIVTVRFPPAWPQGKVAFPNIMGGVRQSAHKKNELSHFQCLAWWLGR